MRKTAIAALLSAAGLTLAACGGATVDSDDVTETQSPAAPSSAEETTTATSTEASTESSSAAPAAPADDPAAGEGAASEVENTPDAAPMRPEKDEAFLEALREGGVNVEGNEEQLVGTARTICDGSTVTRDAVAGQLVEQQATDMDVEELSELIETAARDNLC